MRDNVADMLRGGAIRRLPRITASYSPDVKLSPNLSPLGDAVTMPSEPERSVLATRPQAPHASHLTMAPSEQIDARIGAEQWQQMRDAATAAQVRAACHAHPKLGHAPLEVQCTQGAVQVRGPGLVRGIL